MILQETATKAELASLHTQLDSLASSSHSTEEANKALASQLSTAQAGVEQLQEQIALLQQQAQHDKSDSIAAFDHTLQQREREWRKAKNDAVATALADQAARDEALRQCLHAELAAAAQQEREGLKKDSSAAMVQQAAAQQQQLAAIHQQHTQALNKHAEDFESRLAQHAQQAAAQTTDALAADAARLQQAHAEEQNRQAETASQQLKECKEK